MRVQAEQKRLIKASKDVSASFEVSQATIEDDADGEIQGLRFKLASSLRAEQEMTAGLIVENNRLKRKQKNLQETSGKQREHLKECEEIEGDRYAMIQRYVCVFILFLSLLCD